jgi:NAD(P)-dependent dehydrogenase (short-subunit alcohol dehydrogenase family)
MLDPKGRVAMISGASRGIGRAIAERLLASGYTVSAGVRGAHTLAPHDRLFVHRYDALSETDPVAWVAATMARFGRIDALVNSAGINPRAKLDDTDETKIDAMWQVNIKGPLRLIRAALPHLRAGGEGRVINLASLSGKRVVNENVGYAMTKFALIAMTHSLRREEWAHGIRATALCPGTVNTDMTLGISSAPRDAITQPEDLAVLAETMILLPNTATIGELLVNYRQESFL